MDRRLKYTLYGIGIVIGGLVALNLRMWFLGLRLLGAVIVTNILYMAIIFLVIVYLHWVHKKDINKVKQ